MAVALAAVPAGARANHMQPTVTAILVDEGAAGAERTVRIDVTGSCGPQAEPETKIEFQADLLARWAGDARKPYLPAGAQPIEPSDPQEILPGPAASFRYRIERGILAVAQAHVTCTSPPRGELGEIETATAKSPLSNTIAAPWRIGWEAHGVSHSGGRRCAPPRGKRLQVGVGYDFAWDLTTYLDPRGLLGGAGVRLRDLPKIDLHISGGGRKSLTFHPSTKGFQLYPGTLLNGFYFIAKRPRPVKLWVTIGESRSLTITVPVRRSPRGC